MEWNLTSYEPFIETTYADINYAKVEWNYKWYIKFNSWSDLYIANIPSLIFNKLIIPTADLLSTHTYYVVNKKQNLPYDNKMK